MQQVAPDAPVKTFAGIIAAKDASTTTETHWFGPDKKLSSHEVASTILLGDSILAPSKGDKASDGRPKVALYLPEDKTLQSEFQSQVGQAFANSPGAADRAFQVVKAYYVGKAAKDGRIAADAKDIDTKIVREAIAATIGAPVDFNGRGEVLAPWGMDRATFQDRITTEIRANAKDIEWGPQRDAAIDSIGLSPAGANSYLLTMGKGFLRTKDGNPVVIKIAP